MVVQHLTRIEKMIFQTQNESNEKVIRRLYHLAEATSKDRPKLISCSPIAETSTWPAANTTRMSTALRRQFPDVAFDDFESWAKAMDWNALLQGA
jgi:hypothetical protein